MKLFTDKNLNTMVNVAYALPKAKNDPKKMSEIVNYVESMKYSKAKTYLESVLITWFNLKKPGTAYQLCLSLAYELAQTTTINKENLPNYQALEKLVKAQSRA